MTLLKKAVWTAKRKNALGEWEGVNSSKKSPLKDTDPLDVVNRVRWETTKSPDRQMSDMANERGRLSISQKDLLEKGFLGPIPPGRLTPQKERAIVARVKRKSRGL